MSSINFDLWAIVKWFFVFALFLYSVFSYVIIRQVRIMTKTLELGFNWPIKLLSYLHFLFALGLLFLAVLIL